MSVAELPQGNSAASFRSVGIFLKIIYNYFYLFLFFFNLRVWVGFFVVVGGFLSFFHVCVWLFFVCFFPSQALGSTPTPEIVPLLWPLDSKLSEVWISWFSHLSALVSFHFSDCISAIRVFLSHYNPRIYPIKCCLEGLEFKVWVLMISWKYFSWMLSS